MIEDHYNSGHKSDHTSGEFKYYESLEKLINTFNALYPTLTKDPLLSKFKWNAHPQTGNFFTD